MDKSLLEKEAEYAALNKMVKDVKGESIDKSAKVRVLEIHEYVSERERLKHEVSQL